MGYSQKGYIDGELLEEWIKHFDRYTRRKAGNRPRYVFLDGHKSRLHLPFLLYCRENNIHVVCYPSHSTHVYQGLDVVVFSVLKRAFSDEMLKFEAATGHDVVKSNFLAVYTPAHTRAFSPENVKMAFAKTGIFPFNPDVVPISAMKPSIESSTSGDGLPLIQPSPVRALTKLIKDIGKQKALHLHPEDNNHTIDPQLLSAPAELINDLSTTSAGFLFTASPIKSSSTLPVPISTFALPYTIPKDILTVTAQTTLEGKLQHALLELVQRESTQYGAMAGLQAGMVLQSIYCEKLRSQLFERERTEKQRKGSGKLMNDGLPRCLTSDDFIEKVREFAQRQADEEAAKERKQRIRDKHSVALVEWKKLDAERKKREGDRTLRYQMATKLFKEEQTKAKLEKRPPQWAKPTREPREPLLPKPTKEVDVDEEQEYIDIEIAEDDCTPDSEDDL